MTSNADTPELLAARKSAVTEIVINAKRLIADATAVQAHGSAATAMSLAILAFEEAGKGHILELRLTKPKKMQSWHEFGISSP